MADIAPGTQVRVKVTKTPTNAAARKTIVRVLSKDKDIAAEHNRLEKARRKNEKKTVRGGRLRIWEHRQVKLHPVHGQAGEEGTVTGTYDVLKDLESVSKFVDVQPA